MNTSNAKIIWKGKTNLLWKDWWKQRISNLKSTNRECKQKKRNVNTSFYFILSFSERANLTTRYEMRSYTEWLIVFDSGPILFIFQSDIFTFHSKALRDQHRARMTAYIREVRISGHFLKFSKSPICNVTHSQVRHWIFGRRCPGPVHVLANVMQRNINGHQFWHLVSSRLRRRIIWPDLLFSCYDVTSDTAARGLTQYWPEVWSQFERKLASEPCAENSSPITMMLLQCSKSDTRMNDRAQEQSQTWGHVSHWSQTRRMDSSSSVETHVRPWYWYSCGGQMMLTLPNRISGLLPLTIRSGLMGTITEATVSETGTARSRVQSQG